LIPRSGRQTSDRTTILQVDGPDRSEAPGDPAADGPAQQVVRLGGGGPAGIFDLAVLEDERILSGGLDLSAIEQEPDPAGAVRPRMEEVDTHQSTGGDGQPGLFGHLAAASLPRRLAVLLDLATRDRPARLVGGLQHEEPTRVIVQEGTGRCRDPRQHEISHAPIITDAGDGRCHPGAMSKLFEHDPHPRIEQRKSDPAIRVAEQLPDSSPVAKFNSKLAVTITGLVGTMWCAYVFAGIALIGLPAVLGLTFVPARFSTIVLWVSSEFLQLVLLAVIIVGQNIQSQAADKRAEATYEDADAVLHEAIQIQKHLEAQDQAIQRILALVASRGPGDSSAAPAPPSVSGPPADPTPS
jgi:hypothetical protein